MKKWILKIFDLDRWQEIWMSITKNKFRSVLTGFGVFWGMFMLVVMVGAGIALQRGMLQQIEGFATNSYFVSANRTSEAYKGFQKGRNWQMTNQDIAILESKIPEIQYISPILFGGSSGSGNNTFRGENGGSFSSKGVFPDYNEIDRAKINKGRFINDIDNQEGRKVCVIGQRVYEVLFDKGEDPIGEFIQMNGIYFQVIGVMEQLGSGVNIGGNIEEMVVLPFYTQQKAFGLGDEIHLLAITAKAGKSVKVIEKKVLDELKKQHFIAPTDDAAFWSINLEEQFNMFFYLGIGIASLIWIVGLGTLAAGGIGVSNIMLVTVRERTKEIGIKRALGATPRDIVSQIMTESVIITLIAGVAGIMLGVGILEIVSILLESSEQFFRNPQISFTVAMASLAIILAIGVFAGYLPARRAIKIKAIEAIRQEN